MDKQNRGAFPVNSNHIRSVSASRFSSDAGLCVFPPFKSLSAVNILLTQRAAARSLMFVPTVLSWFYVSWNIIQFQWQLCIISSVGLCVFVWTDVCSCCFSIYGWYWCSCWSWELECIDKNNNEIQMIKTSWDLSRQAFWRQRHKSTMFE